MHARLADVRLFHHALSASEVEKVFHGALRRGLASVHVERHDDALRAQFDELLLADADDPIVKQAADTEEALAREQAEKVKYDAAIPTTMVMEERTEPRETCLLQRGRHDQPDKSGRLLPDTPAVLPPFPTDAPRNRLGLARWIASPENPLTARVAVNRLWQRFFGLGW